MMLAGLWSRWVDQKHDIELETVAVVTTSGNEKMREIHNNPEMLKRKHSEASRMPVIVPPDAYAAWLDPAERNPDQLQGLLKPYPAEQMTAYPVSRVVNSPQNDTPNCIVPVKVLI